MQKQNMVNLVGALKPIPTPARVNSLLYQGNFSARIIELEMAVELDEFSLADLQELMQHYSTAVDHYVQAHSNRYLYFKNKMKSLFLRPRVIAMLNAQDTTAQPAEEKPQMEGKAHGSKTLVHQSRTSAPNILLPRKEKDSFFHMKMENFNLTKDLSAAHNKQQIGDLVDNFTNSHAVQETVIKTSLNDQKTNLRKRLEERRAHSRVNLSQRTMISMDRKGGLGQAPRFSDHTIVKTGNYFSADVKNNKQDDRLSNQMLFQDDESDYCIYDAKGIPSRKTSRTETKNEEKSERGYVSPGSLEETI